MLKNLGLAGKIFLIGILLGGLFSILMGLYFEAGSEITQNFLEAKAGVLPGEPVLLSLTIFLNNLLIVFLASVGPMALVLFIGWSKENISWLERFEGSKYGRVLDRKIWKLINKLKPSFERIKGEVNKDIYIIAYGLPALVLIINGWFFGFILANEFIERHMAGVFEFFKWVAPHGIIEIPAIVASAALGYSFADELSGPLRQEKTKKARRKAKTQIKSNSTVRKLFLIALLLALGAIIEVFLTPKIAS